MSRTVPPGTVPPGTGTGTGTGTPGIVPPGTGPSTPPGAGPARLVVPPGAVVAVAGLPGAGKSTLLAPLAGAGVRVLDPDQVRARWACSVLGRLPYRTWRPLVHAQHALRVRRGVRDPSPLPDALLVHITTRPGARRRLARSATAHRRTALLVLLDVAPETARAGQQARRRSLRPAAQARHEARWRHLLHRLSRDPELPRREGFTDWVRVDRRTAGDALVLPR